VERRRRRRRRLAERRAAARAGRPDAADGDRGVRAVVGKAHGDAAASDVSLDDDSWADGVSRPAPLAAAAGGSGADCPGPSAAAGPAMLSDAVVGPSRPLVEDLSTLSREQLVAATLAHFEATGLSTDGFSSAVFEQLSDELLRTQLAMLRAEL
ncbi:unnamed protein product, partial [Prorocentrum cordatum]